MHNETNSFVLNHKSVICNLGFLTVKTVQTKPLLAVVIIRRLRGELSAFKSLILNFGAVDTQDKSLRMARGNRSFDEGYRQSLYFKRL